MFKRPIAPSLSPNTQKDDVLQAFLTLFTFWKWRDGQAQQECLTQFQSLYPSTHIVFYNSARSALYEILMAFGIGKGDEVIVQPFTCVAVPDPIIWAGAQPVYCDIDETLNLDPGKLEKCITKKTKAIIVQHTFGIVAKIDTIKKIAQKHNILLIEDCAHSLGASQNGRQVGSMGDAAILSFGRDKIISSVFGGAALIRTTHSGSIKKLNTSYKQLSYPGNFWIFQQLLHPVFFSLILPVYTIGLGKIMIVILKCLNLLSRPVESKEYTGEKPDIFPKKFPNALALLLTCQMKKLQTYNRKRQEIAAIYSEHFNKEKRTVTPELSKENTYLRFNILTLNKEKILKNAKAKGILLGNWYSNIIDPKGVDLKAVGYVKGSCPEAERYAALSVNLPTYPLMSDNDIRAVMNLIKEV